MDTFEVLIVEANKAPYRATIDNTLKAMQEVVGGYIQATYPYEDPVALICNEEGKLEGLSLNRAIYGENGEMVDIIAGTFMITGLCEDNFDSLSPDLMDKYEKQFEKPEKFARIGSKIIAVPFEPETPNKAEQNRGHDR